MSDDDAKVLADKPLSKPAPKVKKKAKIQYVRFKNAHTSVVKITGATLRPGELSRSYTSEQASVIKHNMSPYMDSGWIKEVKA